MKKETLEKRVLRNRRGKQLSLSLQRCDETHLTQILELQERVCRGMPRKELFVSTGEEELRESLAMDYCLGAFAGDRLAMFTLMIVNRETPRSLGHALGYDSERLRRTVTFDSTFVSPEHRGYGLQSLALPLKEREAAAMGAREALASVSPENTQSLNNLLAGGFRILSRQELYGGVDRYIVGKTLGKE